jgi:hypothetical protein
MNLGRRMIAAFLLAATMPQVAIGQTDPSVIQRLEAGELPEEVRAALSSTPTVVEILSVRGTERFDGQILKVDELVLQRGAILEFSNLDAPWVALVVRRVRIVDPATMSVFRRDLAVTSGQNGAAGTPGAAGSDGHREGRNGTDGTAGTPGGNGAHGQTRHLPTVYIVVERLERASSPTPLRDAQLTFSFAGLRGGNGGPGGAGGRGGRGGNGRDASTGATGCKHSAGNGGNGASGGRGGNGGNGAAGGNGASLVFVSTQAGADLLSAAAILNDGAEPGRGGASGAGGDRGRFGDGGSRSGYCRSRGHDGGWGSPGAAGTPGSNSSQAGDRGRIQAVIVDDIRSLSPEVSN